MTAPINTAPFKAMPTTQNIEPHILLVEDDPAIAVSLKVTFKREGWRVTWLDNATAVLPKLQDIYEADDSLSGIILDVGLPDGDGLSLCQSIRHSSHIGTLKQLPIVFLTARNDEVDRILGLEMGGDDYCIKPFSPRELVARLKAIWRRDQLTHNNTDNTSESSSSSIIDSDSNDHSHLNTQTMAALQQNSKTINDAHDSMPKTFELTSGVWRYEPLTYNLYWNDTKLELSNTERKLLLALIQSPERVFNREQLLNAISDYPDHRLARTIDSHVKAIRKQLAVVYLSKHPDADMIEVIHTHRGIGYGLYPA